MSDAYTYILQCADDTLYVGWTNDLRRRLEAHNAGRGARYTRGRRPVRLVFWERHDSSTAARQREQALRRLSRVQKLRLVAAWQGREEL